MEGRKKIVVLDDNEVFAELIRASLEEEFDVVVGHNGLQGIALCLEGGVACVVTDIGMPDFDGLRLISELSRNPALSSIPVVVVTASHFNTVSRTEVAKHPQVRRMLSKMENIDKIAGEIRAVLAETAI
jgi:CheY-like chemotaxis protein